MAKSLLSTSKALKATLYILFLAITLGYANSARLLDEAPPEASNPLPTTVSAATSLPSGQIPATTPTTTTVDDTENVPDSPIPKTDAPVAASPVLAPATPVVAEADSPLPETKEPEIVLAPVADVAPIASPVITPPSGPLPVTTPVAGPTATTSPSGPAPVSATTSATVAKPHLSFFMHDILGGSQPSVRVVTGLIANTVLNVPFSKPNNNIFPVSGGTPLTNNNINGFLNNNKNNLPSIAGLSGTTGLTNAQSSTVIQNSGNNNIVSGGGNQPFVTAGQLPAGATLQKLMFGSVTVIDDELTEGQELGSAVMGKAQGFYLASSLDGNSHTMAFTILLHGEEHDVEETISCFGVHRTASPVSHIAVIGGTGKYENANGYAAIESLQQEDQHTTDGVDTIMQISIYLSE